MYVPVNPDRVTSGINLSESFTGFVHKNIKYIEDFQLLDSVLWKRFVEQFREEDADFEGGWRGRKVLYCDSR